MGWGWGGGSGVGCGSPGDGQQTGQRCEGSRIALSSRNLQEAQELPRKSRQGWVLGPSRGMAWWRGTPGTNSEWLEQRVNERGGWGRAGQSLQRVLCTYPNRGATEICDMQCDMAEAASGECPLQHSGGVGRAKPAGDRAQVQWGEKPGQ